MHRQISVLAVGALLGAACCTWLGKAPTKPEPVFIGPDLLEARTAYWQGCDESFAAYAQQHEISLDDGRLQVEVRVRDRGHRQEVQARITSLGGKPISQIGDHLFAWLPVPAVEALQEDPRVAALSWDAPKYQPLDAPDPATSAPATAPEAAAPTEEAPR